MSASRAPRKTGTLPAINKNHRLARTLILAKARIRIGADPISNLGP